MSKVIYKYQIGLCTTLEIPENSKFLDVQIQDGDPKVWFEVDKTAKHVPRKFRIIGTGHDFEGGQYLGTFQSPPFVWHLYEDVNDPT